MNDTFILKETLGFLNLLILVLSVYVLITLVVYTFFDLRQSIVVND